MCLPAWIARRMYSRAGSTPPISSTIRSLPPTTDSKSPVERVRTPVISGRTPTAASIAGARSSSSSLKAAPTVPWPRRPTLNVTERQVLERLAPDDLARISVAAEDDRRPRDRVVVVRHRIPVGAGGGHDQDIARPRVVERHVAGEDVARLAVLAGDGADRVAAQAIGDLRLVARAVAHRAQVVGHAEAELRVDLAGRDERVGRRRDARGHADQHPLPGRDSLEALDVLE